MVLTAAQTTTFFRNEDQMGIPQETFPRLANEGIVTVADLADFNKTSIKVSGLSHSGDWGQVHSPQLCHS